MNASGPEISTTTTTAFAPSPWYVALTTGGLAAKQYWLSAICMWLFGVTMLAGYSLVPEVQDWLDRIGRWKEDTGWKFSLVSTACFGGLLPSLIASCSRAHAMTRGLVISNSLLWGYKGVEIDLFYRLQAWLFGANANLGTIAIKTVCDQFVMVPLFGIVNVVLFYAWRDAAYSVRGFFCALGPNWYRVRVLPILIANWFVWIPAVALIYSLPSPLQLPMQNLILCFWALVLMVFATNTSRP